MQSLVNHLLQLQELVLIRDEHRATGDGSHLERLNENIDALTDKLPPQMKSFFLRLVKKDHVVMAPLLNGSCAICGMRLPISQVQAVRHVKELQNCPSCARVLYESVDTARWVGEQRSRTEPRKVGISRFSAESLMIPNMAATTRDEAIGELAARMQAEGFIDQAAKLVSAALDRENILSTAMDNGLAFPHVRGVEGGGLTLAMGTCPKGIAFDDGKPVSIVCFFTIPTAVSAFYLRLMAGLTETFLKEQNRDALLAAKTTEELWKALTKATRYTIK